MEALSGETDTQIDHVDRISILPPDLIGNILSLLPTTKEAVATSVLSTKWKWSWTFVTRLKFMECLSGSEDQIESLKASFICFVFRVIFLIKPTPLNYLAFRCHGEYYASHVRAWVSAVFPFGVKELDLSIHLRDSDRHVLPSYLFSCKSLVKLKLGRGFRIYVPPIVCLPSLEVLTLECIKFYDDDSFRRFLIGCPVLKVFEYIYCENPPCVLPPEFFTCKKLAILKLCSIFVMNPPTLVSLPSLESLHLTDPKFPDSESFRRFLLGCPSLRELNLTMYKSVDATVLHIDAPMLTDLKLFLEPDDVEVLLSKIVLDTPSLQYLEVVGIGAESLEVTDLSHLVEADICFPQNDTPYQVANNLIMAMSKVQTLCLCGQIIEVITEHGCKLPKFEKMTTLKLGLSIDAGWALLPDLLENSPVLETLVFEEGLGEDIFSGALPSKWYTPHKRPHCLTHHLKLIQVNLFEGGDIEEQEMIKYFIENSGDFVENLTIKYSRRYCLGSKTRIVKEL